MQSSQQLGYSTRQSKKIRRAVFQVIATALGRGEVVETPIGTFRTVAAPPERERWNPIRKTTERAYQSKRRIVFTPAAELIQARPTWYTDEEYTLIRRVEHIQPLHKPWTTEPRQAQYLRAFLQSATNPLKD